MKAAIIGAAAFCVALISLGIYFAVRPDDGPRIVPISPLYAQREKDGGWSRGKLDSKTTVIEYGDIQCPACGAFNPIINGAYDQLKDSVRFEFRHYPLVSIHDKAQKAAIAAEAAGRQGKFWELTEYFYDHQADWSSETVSQFGDTEVQYAQAVGLNVDQFRKDIKDKGILDQITKDMANGDKIPLQGTPTVVINGTALSSTPQSVDDLVNLIKQAQGAS